MIVLISILSLNLESLPGFGVLRLFRAFRVFRLFKRIDSLKSIIEGVIKSLPGNKFFFQWRTNVEKKCDFIFSLCAHL